MKYCVGCFVIFNKDGEGDYGIDDTYNYWHNCPICKERKRLQEVS